MITCDGVDLWGRLESEVRGTKWRDIEINYDLSTAFCRETKWRFSMCDVAFAVWFQFIVATTFETVIVLFCRRTEFVIFCLWNVVFWHTYVFYISVTEKSDRICFLPLFQDIERSKMSESDMSNQKRDGLLSLLVPAPFSGSILMAVIFLLGWGVLQRTGRWARNPGGRWIAPELIGFFDTFWYVSCLLYS